MSGKKVVGLTLAFACAAATAQSPQFQGITEEQIRYGSEIFAQHCSPCHGARMADPNAASDLRKFPPDQKSRFINSVTKGKNTMPPWGDLFTPSEIDALWAYVMAGEKPSQR